MAYHYEDLKVTPTGITLRAQQLGPVERDWFEVDIHPDEVAKLALDLVNAGETYYNLNREKKLKRLRQLELEKCDIERQISALTDEVFPPNPEPKG